MEFCVGTHPYDLWDAGGRDAMLAKHARQLSLNGSFMQEGRRREDAERLRKMLDADGLLAITSHPPFGSYNEPFSVLRQDPDGLQRELAWMKEFLVRCGILGIRAIPLHTGGAMLPQSQPWEVDCAKAYVEALLPTAEKAGVIIAIENTNHAMPLSFYPHMTEQVPLNKNIWSFDDTQKILSFVQAFESPFVRICYDTGHSHLLGRMLADHGAFAPWIALYHLHDNEGAGNFLAVATQPKIDIFRCPAVRVPQPAGLPQLMAGGADDGVIRPGPGHGGQELGDHMAHGRFPEMLAQRPPTEIIGALQCFIRAVQQRNLAQQKIRRGTVGNQRRIKLLVLRIESVHIGPQLLFKADRHGVSP